MSVMVAVREFERFQSTPPQGGRRRYGAALARAGGFNPRPRRGGDHVLIQNLTGYVRFNPRPRRGATSPAKGFRIRSVVSIHAPAGGAT